MISIVKKVLVSFSGPLILVSSVCVLYLLSKTHVIPEPEILLDMISDYYEKYGLITIFVSTLVEGFMFFGLYYTGSIFIALTVLLALSIMSVVNFTIGRTSLMYMKSPSQKLKHIKYYDIWYFVHPTAIAYLSYRLGMSGRSYTALFAVSAGIFASGVFYATVISLLGQELLSGFF